MGRAHDELGAVRGRRADLLRLAESDGKAGPVADPGMDYDELAALYRIAGLGAHREGERQVVDEALRLLMDVVACERPLLFLHAGDSDHMRVYSVTGETGRISMSEPSIVRRIFHSGQGEIVNDVVADPDSNPGLGEWFDADQLAAAPLDVGNQRLGVMVAMGSKRGAFAANDLRMLTLLADRAALSVENAQLRSSMERQGQELTGLHRLSRLLASADTVDYAIGESVRIVSDLLDCEKSAILLYDEATDSLNAHPSTMGMSEQEVEGLKIPLAEPSLAGTVFRTDTPLVSNAAAADAWVGEEYRDLLGMMTVMVVPLTSGLEPLGVLQAVNASKGEFDANDLRFTTLLGVRIASVIEASRSRERERALLHKLREADRTKTEVVSMLAHELKGPMTTIKGFGRALHDSWEELPEARRSHFLDIVTKEIERLSRLVNDLLDMSRMEAGTQRYELEPVALDELIHNMLAVHTSLRAAHLVEADIPDTLPKVLGDRDRIGQVLLNLLTNANRYSPEGTTITVSARPGEEDDKTILVSVADEGIGIAPGDQERVFSKFVMLPKPSWVKKGTGLGLFITKGIVEAHGGRIWVDSEPGVGSTFHFTLRTVADSS
jgi:signal transduction histidine kinase